ncbi:universal stress protein PHOS32-like isoform X1 [Cucurbita moschata]|uniref:Universal stress protein PHOS32-like isoform X1 n=1 Tax=Cucurbita moschata TaxID=3662 RepID=A0A6J1F8B4_CUCMO|nr:universal stress protein PHOS32-like isoform X1 [Cucurbita moschata]
MDLQHQLRKPTLEPDPHLPNIKIHHPASPRHTSTATPVATPTPTAGARRRIGVAVDLSEESAFAIHWAVLHYIRPGDAVILLHVSPTSVLFGADWGSIDITLDTADDNPDDHNSGNSVNGQHLNRTERSKRKLEDDFDAFTASKAADLAKPLKDIQIPYKIHIVKDHDMRERLCLEVERLGLNALIMSSRGFGAAKRGNDGGLGSVSDYCVHHCVCPVVVVRFPDEKDVGIGCDSVAVKKQDNGAPEKSVAVKKQDNGAPEKSVAVKKQDNGAPEKSVAVKKQDNGAPEKSVAVQKQDDDAREKPVAEAVESKVCHEKLASS